MAIVFTIIAGVVGFVCLVGIGANDVANSQAMVVSSGALSLTGAQIIAAVFEFAGMFSNLYVSFTLYLTILLLGLIYRSSISRSTCIINSW